MCSGFSIWGVFIFRESLKGNRWDAFEPNASRLVCAPEILQFEVRVNTSFDIDDSRKYLSDKFKHQHLSCSGSIGRK